MELFASGGVHALVRLFWLHQEQVYLPASESSKEPISYIAGKAAGHSG